MTLAKEATQNIAANLELQAPGGGGAGGDRGGASQAGERLAGQARQGRAAQNNKHT